MTLDASAAAVLEALGAVGGPPMSSLTPADARAAYAGLALLTGEGPEVAAVEHRSIGGVPAVVITPHSDAPLPVLVWMHGGGWTIGAADETVGTCRILAAKTGCIVVSLDYRLAPEHKAPAAYDDAISAIEWVLQHAAELGGDPARVAVGGESAGVQLSAAAAQHFGNRLSFQLLVFPATDCSREYPSMAENADGYLLTADVMRWFYGHYVDGSGIDRSDPRLSPLLAADAVVAAAAQALVITAGYDPLRDEGEAYAARLQALGVPCTLRRFPGQIHLFFSLGLMVPEAGEAHDLAASMLREAFTR